MVDWIVSTAVEKLKTEVVKLVGFPDEIRKLSSTFTSIQALLEDAESRRVKDGSVKIWLEKVKDVAYDVEDILDEWMTEALKSKVADEGDGSSRPVTNFINPLTRRKLGSRIEEAMGRLDEIYKEMSQFHLSMINSGVSERVYTEARQHGITERETSSLLDQPFIVGRKEVKERVVDLLLGGSGREVNEVPFVISIVGMGGLGKTALAQLIYNDENVEKHFDKRMWVCVSQDFDVKRITKSIIESATRKVCKLSDLDPLQKRLRGMLKAKRFLLVLDDVWSHDSENWDKLRRPFQAGAHGSRIIVTTRLEDVASTMGSTDHMQKLDVLSHDDCWLVFSGKALEHRSAEERLDLEEIGREIANNCGGLPLAAKTIGSAMRSRKKRRQWELVLKSGIWQVDISGGISPALLLSYHYLPTAMKQCFAYCSIFPKGWRIEKDRIVKLWVAQGFICSKRSEEMEEIGGGYFEDLLRCSLLQYAELDRDKNIVSCKMHDLVHDLAQSVAGSECSVVEMRKLSSLSLNNLRHLYLIDSDDAGDNADEATWTTLYEANKLRTLLFISRISREPNNLFHHFRHLRALDLSCTRIQKLPQTVGKLKHLRYLDLSMTMIEELPEELSNCRNLQTLKLNSCGRLKKLPRGMRKMIDLRHLELEGINELKYLPQGIGKLSSLRTLTKFIVGGDEEGCKWGELKHLNHLQGSLYIKGLENVTSRDEAGEAELNKKQYLHTVTFKYNASGDDEQKRTEEVLEILQPHTKLKELEIQRYGGSKLPKWTEDPVFSYLVTVKLRDCDRCKQLPGLGKLPSLKYLDIEGMKEVIKVGGEFSGDDNNEGRDGGSRVVSFPKLETLIFQIMPNWEEWELRGGDDGEVMPSLLELVLVRCSKLKALPSNLLLLPLLQKLTLDASDVGMSSGVPLPVLPKLNHLVIAWSRELRSFPCGWLGQLKALRTLEIKYCRNLRSLPEELQHLTMLQQLKIWSCPELRSLPEELGHLTMLQQLNIYECPVLEERYREGGDDRDKIARIPNITFGLF